MALIIFVAWSTRRAILLGIVLFLVYSANGRELGTNDDWPSRLLPIALVRGDGPVLDRFRSRLQVPGEGLLYSVSERRGHLVSRYPIATPLVATPLFAVQMAVLDRARPGWERDVLPYALVMSKNAAALLGALLGVVLFRLLVVLEVGSATLPALVGGVLGSNLWVVGSQTLGPHGPAALALAMALLILARGEVSNARLAAAGAFAGALVAFRLPAATFAGALAAFAIAHHRWRSLWFLGPLAAIGCVLLAWNLSWFGAVTGGEVELEALHPILHGVTGNWSRSPLVGLAGTLVSPSRGLFVFSPWVAVVVARFPTAVRGAVPVARWASLALIANLVVFSTYSVWWSGHAFGPRYWTESTPVFVVALAYLLVRARERSRPLLVLLLATLALSVAVQVVGAFCYPSGWSSTPTEIDLDHARLWDVRDSELTRCLARGSR
jgi:hypothetical protein